MDGQLSTGEQAAFIATATVAAGFNGLLSGLILGGIVGAVAAGLRKGPRRAKRARR